MKKGWEVSKKGAGTRTIRITTTTKVSEVRGEDSARERERENDTDTRTLVRRAEDKINIRNKKHDVSGKRKEKRGLERSGSHRGAKK